MSKENQELLVSNCATVALFDCHMKRILLVYNNKILAFMPPGGKEETGDLGIPLLTAFREVLEEVGIDVEDKNTGVWLDIHGQEVNNPVIVQTHQFRMHGKKYIDYLYFFRLAPNHQEEYSAELKAKFYEKSSVLSTIISGVSVLVPGNREAILAVMK